MCLGIRNSPTNQCRGARFHATASRVNPATLYNRHPRGLSCTVRAGRFRQWPGKSRAVGEHRECTFQDVSDTASTIGFCDGCFSYRTTVPDRYGVRWEAVLCHSRGIGYAVSRTTSFPADGFFEPKTTRIGSFDVAVSVCTPELLFKRGTHR